MFITHRKDLLIGDYLIDDRTKNGAGEFRGERFEKVRGDLILSKGKHGGHFSDEIK